MTTDPALTEALSKFSPAVQRDAMSAVDSFIDAINAGDEALADELETALNAARGQYGAAIAAIMAILNTAPA